MSDEIIHLKEDISALVNGKDELGRERTEVKHSLENVSEQLNTVQSEMIMFQVGSN